MNLEKLNGTNAFLKKLVMLQPLLRSELQTEGVVQWSLREETQLGPDGTRLKQTVQARLKPIQHAVQVYWLNMVNSSSQYDFTVGIIAPQTICQPGWSHPWRTFYYFTSYMLDWLTSLPHLAGHKFSSRVSPNTVNQLPNQLPNHARFLNLKFDVNKKLHVQSINKTISMDCVLSQVRAKFLLATIHLECHEREYFLALLADAHSP